MAKQINKVKKYTIEQLYDMPLSKLIKVAVADIQLAVKKGYKIDMDGWGYKNGDCVGCFAGHCIMANNIKLPQDGYRKIVTGFMNDNEYGYDVGQALDHVRCGSLTFAVKYLYTGISEDEMAYIKKIPTRHWDTYDILNVKGGFNDFTTDMLRIAAELKKGGF